MRALETRLHEVALPEVADCTLALAGSAMESARSGERADCLLAFGTHSLRSVRSAGMLRERRAGRTPALLAMTGNTPVTHVTE